MHNVTIEIRIPADERHTSFWKCARVRIKRFIEVKKVVFFIYKIIPTDQLTRLSKNAKIILKIKKKLNTKYLITKIR